MSGNPTEYQSPEEQRRSRRLSVQRTRPPGEAPGYEIQRFLGAGAYGEVWVGLDANTGRRVAIKFYLHRGGLDWTLLAREVEKLVFLSADRYVVQLLDVGWHAEPPYYVMEFMENGSLDDLLSDAGPLAVADAVEMFREVAVGLTHAHDKGVLHCDLKPANVLLDQDRRPRLADFGQSRLSDEQTPALGTLFYMAPEQADLKAVPDARWDVYALGAMLYCMLTGQPPYRSDEMLDKIDATGDLPERLACYRHEIHATAPPQAHRSVPGVDYALADIIDNCLAVRPERRFANAQVVLEALAVRDRARSRRPLLVLGLVGPILLLLVMIAFSWAALNRAVSRSESMVQQQTYRSNEFAAKFVAASFEAEIADYFGIVEQEAKRTELLNLLPEVLRSELLANLNRAGTDEERVVLRERFLADPHRLELRRYCERRLADFRAASDPMAPQFASIFVTDPLGTIVAAAYDDRIYIRSEGRNYSWRSYFHGGPEDLPESWPRELPPHIQSTHLSAVFKSSTTEKWKVGITTPVYANTDGQQRFLGVLAMTINVGDFAIFRNRERPTEYFAVLIDNRQGERHGTILQHPLFQERSPADDYRVPEKVLQAVRNEPVFDYHDPIGTAPGGTAYAGDWIAAAEPVRVPGRDFETRNGRNGNARTDLLVLVQVSADAVTAPVKQLGRRLAFDGLSAMVVVIGVVTALWLVVLRFSREPGGKRRRNSHPPSSERTPGQSPTTLPLIQPPQRHR
jgi:serine/threonine protein kinase